MIPQTSYGNHSSSLSPFPLPVLDVASEKSSSPQDSPQMVYNQSQPMLNFDFLSHSLEEIPELNLDLVSQTLQDTANSSSGVFSNDSNELNFLASSPTNSIKHEACFNDVDGTSTQIAGYPSESDTLNGDRRFSLDLSMLAAVTSASTLCSSLKNGGSTAYTIGSNPSREHSNCDLLAVKDLAKTDANTKQECLEFCSTSANTKTASRNNDGMVVVAKSHTSQNSVIKTNEIKSVEETTVQSAESDVAQSPDMEKISPESKPKSAEKLGMSYITLLAQAILSCSEQRMVLSDIYKYILEHNPFFQNTTCAWRNSVRYTLSVNECFMKDGRATSGRGYYWAIHPACLKDFMAGDFNRRNARKRVQETIKKLEDSIQHAKASYNQMATMPCGWAGTYSTTQSGGSGAMKSSKRNIMHTHPYSPAYASPVHLNNNHIQQHNNNPVASYHLSMPQPAGTWDPKKSQMATQWPSAGPGMSLVDSQSIPMAGMAQPLQSTMYDNQASLLYTAQTQVWSQNNSHDYVFYN